MKYVAIALASVSCLLASCVGEGEQREVSLVETQDTISFSLTPSTSVYNHTFQVFTDTDGKEYAHLMNRKSQEIFIYDIAGGEPVKVVKYQVEGPDGLGQVYSHYMKSWNEFLIPGQNKRIFMIDSLGTVQWKLDYGMDENVRGFESYFSDPFVLRNDTLYSYQSVRRTSEHRIVSSPTEIAINLKTKDYVLSPDLQTEEIKKYHEGRIESHSEVGNRDKCYDGKSLIYSYSYNEDLVVMSMDFKNISYKKARSKYIGDLSIPNFPEGMDFAANCREFCTNPYYGRICYDPYRKLYYRFAYPKTELEKHDESWYDLTQSGRDEFSIIILDEDLNVIGETMFPRDRFRSNLYFVCKDGFYISCNHYKNPGYTDDELQFVKFEIEK